MGFQTFGDSNLQRALDAASLFASSLNRVRPYWLTLAGVSGLGKTHLAKRVFRYFMDWSRHQLDYDPDRKRVFGNTAIWCDWRKLCAGVRRGEYGWVEDICEEWFVVLDDIGTEHDPSGHIASVLDQIISGRSKKWTLITVNLTLDQIATRLDTRIASRMLRDNGQVVEMEGIDYNLRQRENSVI